MPAFVDARDQQGDHFRSKAQPLLVACVCGALAGACGAITSHPIDTIFALRTTGALGTLESVNHGLSASVWAFAGSLVVIRAIITLGAIISLETLLHVRRR